MSKFVSSYVSKYELFEIVFKEILMKIAFVRLLIPTLLVTACSKEESKKPVMAKPKPANKVMANQWCSIESMTENFQVVTRYTFSTDKVRIDYLRISDDSKVIIYKAAKQYPWEMKTDENLWFNRYSVDLIENDYDVRYSRSHGSQENLRNYILKKNPKFKAVDNEFKPKIALSLARGNLLTSNNSESTLFPCATYASEFTAETPVRPMIEFSLFLGQSLWSFDDGERNGLSRTMLLSFPIELKKISEESLSGTHWCSWFQMWTDSFMLDIISFGKKRYAKSNVSGVVFEKWVRGEDHATQKYIENRAKEARIFSITENNDYLRGELNSLPADIVQSQDLFALIHDAQGTKILVRLNPYTSDVGLMTRFSGLYFSCADPRPLSYYHAGVKTYLPKFLEVHSRLVE